MRSLRLVVTVFASLVALLGALSPSAALAQKRGGTLVMIVQPEPPSLASYQNTSAPIGQVSAKIYDGLLEYGFDFKPQPSLAKSWTVSPDGKTITFRLQEGVKFHDGKPFTSADVQFTFMNALKKVHPRGPITFRDLEAVDTPDPLTAVFRFGKPAPYALVALSGYESPILPKHLFETGDLMNHPNANKPVGTGPFKFVEWEKGQYIRLDRNPDYWRKGAPYLDRIVARFIGDAGTRTAAMEKQEAQIAAFSAVPSVELTRLKALPFIDVSTKGYEMISPIVLIELNTTRKPFDNQKVRQAVSYALDRKAIIDTVFFGYGKPATGPISSNFAANGLYTRDVRNYAAPDAIEMANRLLDEAGYPRKGDGVRFEMIHDVIPYGEDWRRMGELIVQQLGKVGIKVTLRYEDVPTWLRRIYTNYDFEFNSNFLYTLPDPVLGVHRTYWSKNVRPGAPFSNSARLTLPKVDELLEAATVEPDHARRVGLYHEFQKIVVDQAPVIWVTELDFTTVTSRKLHDYLVSPLGVYTSFDRAWLE
jgi:peptide/nickel transport system substrate-binding protein